MIRKGTIWTVLAAVMVGVAQVAFAQEAGVGAGAGQVGMGAGQSIGFAALGCGIGQGLTAGAALVGIARNPGASGKMFVPMILGLVLIESLAIYALLISFQLVGKMGG